MGAGGAASRDAGAAISMDGSTSGRDGSLTDAGPPNVFADAPVFNPEVGGCPGCGGSSSSDAGVVSGTGGVGGNSGGGKGGSTASSGSGGSSGAGGAMGTGGRAGTGGAAGSGTGGHPMADAGMSLDAQLGGPDALPPREDASPDAVFRDAAGIADAGVADARPNTDTSPFCSAQLVPVWPTSLAESRYLVAGASSKIILRAEIVAGAVAPGTPWTWQAKANSTPIAAETNAQDPAAAAFVLASDGVYTFTASAGSCVATLSKEAYSPSVCPTCNDGLDVQVVAPPSYGVPAESNYFVFNDSIRLAEAATVRLFTNLGTTHVASYVRINDDARGGLAADGYLDPSAGFSRPLLVRGGNGDLLKYQVLVVPLDGTGDGSVGASAPQLFRGLTVPALQSDGTLALAGGVTVTGRALTSAGQGVNDVRVMLSNQDPSGSATPANLIFSSVGRSDAQGSFTLKAQPGAYWVTVSPPAASGLSEAIAPTPVNIAGSTSVTFQWDTPKPAALTLQVLDAAGNPAGSARVLVRSTQSTPVGTLSIQSAAGAASSQSANGNVQLEGTTDPTFGTVTFPALPADSTYDVLLVPGTLGPLAATTSMLITVPSVGLTQTVSLAAEGSIAGQLVTAVVGLPAVDWSQVQVVAFDESRVAPEAPRATLARSDGSFVLGVSPGRSYAVLAWPNPSTGLARTFVGPGLLQSSVFTITQRVQQSKSWASTVSVSRTAGAEPVSGAALRATCHADYWWCIDPSIPLAEATSGDGGAFVLAVPDPASR
jgi:hypothetical protein